MTTASSNIVETLVYIPFVEASKPTTDLLVENTVLHYFLRIPQSTFPTLPSTVKMESIRSLTQTMMTTSSNIVETFVYIPFVEDSEMTIDLLVQKTVVHNFLRIPQSTFPMLPSTVHMESTSSSTQTLNTSSNIVETFVYIPFVEASEPTIDLLMEKTVVHYFLRIPQSTFPTLPSTVKMESIRSSTQTMMNTSSNIVETFVYIPFVVAQEMRIDLLVQKNVVHNFCGFRKVRFQRYRPQFKWNQAVRLPTQ